MKESNEKRTRKIRKGGTVFYIKETDRWGAQISITIKGKRTRKSVYAKTKEEAIEKLETLRIKIKDQQYLQTQGIRLYKIMEEIRDKKYESNIIKDSTYLRISKTINKIKESNGGKMNIKEITSNDIQNYLNEIKKYSNSYICKIYEQLNQTFNYAIRNKYITDNPLYDVIKPKSTQKLKKVRALTMEEQKKLSDYLLNTSIRKEKYKNIFLIQMYTGLRIGEVLSLTVEDIDLERKIIKVNKTLSINTKGKIVLHDSTKTYAGIREVPIPEFIIPHIEEQLKEANRSKKRILFSYKRKYLSHNIANSKLKRIMGSTLKMKNIEGISTHSLRHTFATRCIEAGMAAVVLQRILGHTNISITLNTYTSVFNQFKDSELQKVVNLYEKNILNSKEQ